MPLHERPQLAWPYLNPNSPLYQGLVFAGLGPHPGGYDFHDCSPYRNDGRLTNMDPATDWVWSPELGRLALDFLPADKRYISLPTSIAPAPHLSVFAWVRFDALDYQGIVGRTSAVTTYGFNIRARAAADGRCDFFVGNGTTSKNTRLTVPYVVGEATSIGLVYDGAHLRPYWNGSPLTPSAFADGVAYSTETIEIGRYPGIDSQYFTGWIADVIIYSRALTLSEISALADPSNAMLEVGGCPLILPPRRRLFAAAVAGTSPISGSTTFTFTPTGSLVAKGAASGNSSLTFTPSGALLGTAGASGTGTVTFSPTGVVAGKGAASGTTTITFSPTGTLAGSGALSGVSPLTFTPSGAIAGIVGASGQTSFTFTPSGSLAGSGALSGEVPIVFTPAGLLAGTGQLVGTSQFTFTPTGTIRTLEGILAGSVIFSFTPTGLLTATGELKSLVDQTLLIFTPTGLLTRAATGPLRRGATAAIPPLHRQPSDSDRPLQRQPETSAGPLRRQD